ncbi:dihydrolipoamide acetyltransferase family protein [Pseudonocardia sp.]|uniref:dihydrolipoamide acetyltransferase family protein n=1 Tax=Pseudonocardia sp. TaxID=60912 RepID=UPI003D0F898A
MATLLTMPEVAAGTTEAVLSHWLVGENTPFAAGDTIAVIETEKAAVDLEADSDAKLVRSLVADGATVSVGTPLAVLAEPDEDIDDIAGVLAELGVALLPTPLPSAASGAPEVGPRPDARPHTEAPSAPRRVFMSPLVRKLAADNGLDLTEVAGSGPHGRIVRRDVEKLLAASPAPEPAAKPTRVAEPAPELGPATVTRVEHTRMRRAIARRLTASKEQIPHFYLRGTARIDALLELRASLNQVAPTRVSVNDLLLKAAARAHRAVPDMNVVWSDDALLQYHSVDIGVAIASDRGLVTPVLRGVDSASISTLSAQAKDLVTRANAGRLGQAELEGGTMTISNLGPYGVEEFVAIINPPQSAILAVGAGRKQPIVGEDGSVRSATVLRVVLSVDHRAVDGAIAGQWMQKFVETLEQPFVLLV